MAAITEGRLSSVANGYVALQYSEDRKEEDLQDKSQDVQSLISEVSVSYATGPLGLDSTASELKHIVKPPGH